MHGITVTPHGESSGTWWFGLGPDIPESALPPRPPGAQGPGGGRGGFGGGRRGGGAGGRGVQADPAGLPADSNPT